MKISTLDAFTPELDQVALESPYATFYHTGTWLQSVAAAYPRMSLRCLVAEQDGRVAGYLPYFITRRGPLRRAWSLPFGTYGGPACVIDDAARPLLEAYAALLSRPGLIETGWVDFRKLTRTDEPDAWYEAHLVDLTVGYDRVFAEKFSKKRRQRVRGAQRLGIAVERDRAGAGLGDYYRIFADKIEGFGRRPLYPEHFYRELLDRGRDRVRLYMAYRDGTPLGGHLNFYFKDTVIAWYSVVSKEHERTQVGSLLFAACMRDACEEGYATYNLGASIGKDSLTRYKRSLGGVPHRYPVHVTRSLLGRLVERVRS